MRADVLVSSASSSLNQEPTRVTLCDRTGHTVCRVLTILARSCTALRSHRRCILAVCFPEVAARRAGGRPWTSATCSVVLVMLAGVCDDGLPRPEVLIRRFYIKLFAGDMNATMQCGGPCSSTVEPLGLLPSSQTPCGLLASSQSGCCIDVMRAFAVCYSCYPRAIQRRGLVDRLSCCPKSPEAGRGPS
jgi:hypothetical protein